MARQTKDDLTATVEELRAELRVLQNQCRELDLQNTAKEVIIRKQRAALQQLVQTLSST